MRCHKTSRRLVAVVGAMGLLLPAWGGTLQLQVQDKNGKPLPEAIVFLESAEAKPQPSHSKV